MTVSEQPGSQIRNWRFWFALIFTLCCLMLAVRGLDLSEVWRAFEHVRLGLLFISLGFALTNLFARAFRWKLLYSLKKDISLQRAYSVMMIGLMVNAFTPVRLGELTRAFLLGEVEEESKVYTLGTVFVEKLLEMVMFVISVVVLVFLATLPNWLLTPSQALAITTVTLLPLVSLAIWQRDFLLTILNRFTTAISPTKGKWFMDKAYQALSSLQVLENPVLLIKLFLWSVVILALAMLSFDFVFRAMGLTLPLWAALFVLVVMQAGVAIPSSPGSIGVFHYLAVLSLSVFNVEQGVAFSTGIILHLLIYLPMTILGTYFLWHENLAWKTLTSAVMRLGKGG